MGVKHLLLDLDGTLNISWGFPQRAVFIPTFVWELRRRLGLSPFRAMAVLHDMRISLEGHQDPHLPNRARSIAMFAARTGLPHAEAERVLLATLETCFARIRPFFRRNDLALQFVAWARARYDLILATNPVWPEEITAKRIGWAGLESAHFSWITHSGNMRSAKPQARYFSELLENAGLDGGLCLMVGNDPRKDGPARESGVPVFLVTPHRSQSEEWRKQGYLSGTFDDLKAYLEQRGPA